MPGYEPLKKGMCLGESRENPEAASLFLKAKQTQMQLCTQRKNRPKDKLPEVIPRKKWGKC